MVISPYSTPFLQLAYRTDLHLLTGRWLCSTSEAELYHGCEQLRRAALHHQCGNWLVDSRRCANRCPDRLAWVASRFLPQTQRELGGTLRAGFLVLPDYLLTLASPAAAVPDAALQFALFLDEGAASAWLAAA